MMFSFVNLKFKAQLPKDKHQGQAVLCVQLMKVPKTQHQVMVTYDCNEKI